MINFKDISIFFLIILGNNFYSQQTPNFSQFFLKDYFYNPSLGVEEYDFKINYLHRKWGNNYQFSPKNDFIGLALPLRSDKKFGFLFSFLNDQNGQAFKTVVINPGVYYVVKLASSLYLGTGLSFNFSEHSFINDNLDNLEFGDLSLQNIKQTSITPSFGLNLKFDNSKNFKFQLGFSSTNIHDFRQPINKSLVESITEQYNANFKIRIGKINKANFSWITLFRGHNGIINYNGWSNTRLPKSISSAISLNNIIFSENKFSFGGIVNGFFDENEKLEPLSISPFISGCFFKDFPFKLGISYDIGLTKFHSLSNGIMELSVTILADDFLNKKSTKNLEELDEEDDAEKKKVNKYKNFKVGNIRIKTGDNSYKPITLQNNESVSPINLIGSNFDKEINGFRIKFKLLDTKKKMPKEICYNVKTYSIKDGIEISGEILRQNQQVTIKKGSDDYSNWITLKLEKGSDIERYIVEIYNCNNPKEKFSLKLKRDWR